MRPPRTTAVEVTVVAIVCGTLVLRTVYPQVARAKTGGYVHNSKCIPDMVDSESYTFCSSHIDVGGGWGEMINRS